MLLLVLALAQGPIELRPGMVITQSVVIKTKTYHLSGAPITIRGDSITVDFGAATLLGSGPEVEPDQRRDTAIVIGLDLRTAAQEGRGAEIEDRKSTRLNSSHANISYAVFCLKKKRNK